MAEETSQFETVEVEQQSDGASGDQPTDEQASGVQVAPASAPGDEQTGSQDQSGNIESAVDTSAQGQGEQEVGRATTDTPAGTSQDTPQDEPQDSAETVQQDASQDGPQDAASQGAVDTAHQDAPEDGPQDVAPQDAPPQDNESAAAVVDNPAGDANLSVQGDNATGASIEPPQDASQSMPPESGNPAVATTQDEQIGGAGGPLTTPTAASNQPNPPAPLEGQATLPGPVNKVGDELPVGASDPIANPISRGPHKASPGMQTTNLGVLLLEATYKPSASTILLPQVADAKFFPHEPQHLQTVVSEAPQNQKHAEVWVKAINAAKNDQASLEVDGTVLNQPHFVSLDADNKLVEAPLNSALLGANLEQTSIVATSRDAPPMLQVQRFKPDANVPSDPATVTIEAPSTLMKGDISTAPATLTPHGFVLGGSLSLFGLVSAQLYTCHGTASGGVTDMAIITGGSASEPGTISVGSIVSSLKGTAVDDIQFRKTHLSYYEKPSPVDKRLGLYLEADVAFEGSLKSLAEDVDHFFGLQAPTLHISSHLGLIRDWNNVLNPPYFNISVSFLNLNKKFGEMITFTSVEIAAMVQNPGHSDGLNGSSVSWTWSFTGNLQLTVPGSIVPLSLTFHIITEGKSVQIIMMMGEGSWEDAFGIKGLSISNAQFSGSYDAESGNRDIDFDVAAAMNCGGFELDLSGFYHGKDTWGFISSLDHFDWSDICSLYTNFFDQGLEDFDHHEDIAVSNLTLSFSSLGREFAISGTFKIHDYSSVNTSIVISQTGIQVTASLETLKFDDVDLEEASLDVFIGKTGTTTKQGVGTAVRFNINGKVKFLDNLEVSVGVFFDKEPTSKELQWAIYGKLEEGPRGHSIGSLSSAVRDNKDLDMPLSNVAFIASNADTVPAGFPSTVGYPVVKGAQICASLGSVEMIDKALNAKPSNLTLRALLSREELEIEIIISSTTMNLSFAPNVKSGALKLGIDIPKGASPSLFVEADFAVTVAKQPQPLAFALRLDVSAIQAKGTAMMTSDWVNPLGISEQLTVGQVALEVGIIYANAIYPNELGFGGHLKVGEVDGRVAIEITDDPAEGLFIVELIEPSRLDIIDLVKFARVVCKNDAIPEPTTDFLIFEEFKLDVSTGVMFAGAFYPAGVLFKSVLELFGKKISVDCEINKSPPSIIAKGSIDPFALGPLTVKASKFNSDATKPGPSLDLEFGSARQHISLDGEVILAGFADVAISLVAELHPDLKFSFDADIEFLEHLKFTMHAAAVGDFKEMQDLSKLDFVVTVHFEQDIVKTIIAQINTMLLAAKHAVDETANEAKATLAKAEAAFNAEIDKAQKDLDATKAIWDKKHADAQAEADRKQADVIAESQRLQKSVDDAKKAFDGFIGGLEANLTSTEQHMNDAIAAAEKILANGQAEWDGKLNGAQQKLSDAQAALTREFGDADQALNDAEAQLQSAQDSANSLEDDLGRERQAYDEAGFFAKIGKAGVIAGLEVEEGVRTAAVAVAEGVVETAKAVVDGPLYQAAQQLTSEALKGLQDIRELSDEALQGLRNDCEAVRNTEKPLFDAAKDKLESAKTSCDQLGVWNNAKQALGDFEAAKGAVMSAAAKALDAIESCAEKIAYDAAVLALSVAKANTHDIDLAKHAVSLVQEGADGLLEVGQYMIQKAGDFIDITSVDLSGSLRGLVDENAPVPLDAKLKGTFMGNDLDLDMKFKLGEAKEFVKALFEECWRKLKAI